MLNKRGQLYLLAAIIIGFIVFSLAVPSNIVKKTVLEDEFTEIADNFRLESSRFLNGLINDNANVEESFLNFTILFTSFSKTKNPDFGILYAFIYENRLYYGNYLQDAAEFNFQGQTRFLNGCFSKINAQYSIAGLDLDLGDIDYAQLKNCQGQPIQIVSPPYILHVKTKDMITNEITEFDVELSKGVPEIIMVAREKSFMKNIRRVYAKGKFI